MAEDQRNIEEITFFGGQDSDTALEGVKKGNFLYALNIINNSSGEGNKGIVTTPKGTLEVSFSLPSTGKNTCIGTAEDHENYKFYFFIQNEFGFHGIYEFNGLTKSVISVLLNKIDTGNVDILKFNKDYLILHADVRNGLAYWVDGLNNARKTNIKKLLDKSETGYGDVILQSYIDAYKRTSANAPTAVYFSDVTKTFNRLYGALRKFAIRFIYDDGEKSNWSDFSGVALPSNEPFTGINTIPTNNNGLKITFETGDRTVIAIELAMQATSAAVNDLTILNWVSIATINKRRSKISNNSLYTYSFYNDSNYAAVNPEKIIRPHSYLPKVPVCQALVKNALVYANGKQGSPFVEIDVEATITYEDLFIDSGVENKFNEPNFVINNTGSDFVRSGTDFTYYNGTVMDMRPSGAPSRFARQTITIGHDVKKGNYFQVRLSNGKSADTFELGYTATLSDTASTVAFNIKEQLISTGRIYRKTPDIVDSNIYDNSIDSAGNVTFSYIIKANKSNDYIKGYSSVNAVQYNTLKDTGQSVRNPKLGSSIKIGLTYEDFDGRKSLTYTVDALILSIKTINELGGYKSTIITLKINHKAPKWAKYYQIVRSNDLTYGKYIQLLIQKVIPLNNDDLQDYLDLSVGSLYTYQKIHPNTSLNYQFSKGDRLRLLRKATTGELYPFFETEIITYNDIVKEVINSNVLTDGSASVAVAASNSKNIGKFIVIDGNEREILGVPDATHYLLSNVIGGTEQVTYLSYELIDKRGTVRIRKPSLIVIEDNSIIELYKPSSVSNPLGSKEFFEFQKKFSIINPGTDEAYHSGSDQDQSATQPAIVKITEGTAYVRNREFPINNIFPGTQMIIQSIEDDSYSDFYSSNMNDNGRVSAEDTGDGEVHFGSRMWYSNNSIEDTRINGLNDFDNLDREDYNDKYGDFKRIVFDKNNIYTFKTSRSAYVPVDSKLTIDDVGTILRAGSAKLLNPIQYFPYEGGIGNNPEAYCSNDTHKYVIYSNAGVIVRIGGNGEEPISKTFFLDKEVRELLIQATKNKAKIFLGFNRKLSLLIVSIEGYNKYVYFDGFNGWELLGAYPPDGTIYEIVTQPQHGTVTLTGGEITYQSDVDYVGHDNYTYRAFINGQWSNPEKVCIDVIDVPVQLDWRPIQPFCVKDQYGLRTGFKGWELLEEFNVFDGKSTGNQKPNLPGDADYAAPIVDEEACVPQPVQPNPNPINFTPKIDAEISTVYESNTEQITGINIPVAIFIHFGEYKINDEDWTSAPGVVVNNDMVKVRALSSENYNDETVAILAVGNQTANFSITTVDEVYPFKWVPDMDTAYCVTEDIVINNFDFLVARFMWDYPSAGRDLDIQVQFENNDTPTVDNYYVGYGSPNSSTIPVGTVPETDTYLWWGLDDTNSSAQPIGIEGVLVGLKKFKNDFPSSPNIIEVGIYAVWYGVPVTGNFNFEVVTYKGGTMSKVGTNIINTGGTLVSSDVRSLNTMIHNQLHVPASSYKVGVLRYDKTTDQAVFIIS